MKTLLTLIAGWYLGVSSAVGFLGFTMEATPEQIITAMAFWPVDLIQIFLM